MQLAFSLAKYAVARAFADLRCVNASRTMQLRKACCFILLLGTKIMAGIMDHVLVGALDSCGGAQVRRLVPLAPTVCHAPIHH